MINIEVKFDASALEAKLVGIPEAMKDIAANVLNSYGQIMISDLVRQLPKDIAGNLFEEGGAIDSRAVGSAMTVYPASSNDLEYSIKAQAGRFPYAQWVTEHDEKVCKICNARDGRYFSKADLIELFPAHPNCRCHTEDVPFGSHMLEAANELIGPLMEHASATMLEMIGDKFK